jgi:PAS domain S-box-containing protein
VSADRPVVLVVDDERGMRETIADVLDLEGIEVHTAGSGAAALEALPRVQPALAIVDYRLPDMTGIELAGALKAADRDIVVVALTGHASLESAIAAVGLVDVYLTKPAPPEQLLTSVRSGLERRALVQLNRSLVAQLQEANRQLAARVDERTRQLSESEMRLMTFIDFAPDAVIVLDDGGEIVVANAGAEAIAGVARDALVGTSFDRYLRVGDAPGAPLASLLWASPPAVREPVAAFVVREDATTVPVSVAARRLPGTDPALLAVSIRDETDRRETEAALRQADAMKDEFLATVSHELRTPLAAVAGFAELLRKPDVADEEMRAHLLERVAANAEDMRRMVERLLDFARLSAGRVRCEPRPVDLAAEVHAGLGAHAHELHDRPVEVDVPSLRVRADPDALGHVLGNLLSNAAKFSPGGSPVAVSAVVDDGVAVVRVADHGPGVPPELAEALFDRFVQGPASSPTRRGAGLGLAIARRYVELQGGRIWFEDVPAGATVAFTLPLDATS